MGCKTYRTAVSVYIYMVNILKSFLTEGKYWRDVIVAHSCSVHFSLILRISWMMGKWKE